MSNPVARYFDNTIEAARDNYHAAKRHQGNRQTIKALTEKSETKELTPKEQEALRNAKINKPKSEQKVADTRGKFFGALLLNRTYVDRKTGRAK